jgi:hypothetical protein
MSLHPLTNEGSAGASEEAPAGSVVIFWGLGHSLGLPISDVSSEALGWRWARN